MNIKNVKTIQDLMQYQNASRQDIEWFLACTLAEGCSENRLKDNAELFLGGITPIKDNDEESNSIIEMYMEDVEVEENGEEHYMITDLLKRHFG